jgi:hypothetical protein
MLVSRQRQKIYPELDVWICLGFGPTNREVYTIQLVSGWSCKTSNSTCYKKNIYGYDRSGDSSISLA